MYLLRALDSALHDWRSVGSRCLRFLDSIMKQGCPESILWLRIFASSCPIRESPYEDTLRTLSYEQSSPARPKA